MHFYRKKMVLQIFSMANPYRATDFKWQDLLKGKKKGSFQEILCEKD